MRTRRRDNHLMLNTLIVLGISLSGILFAGSGYPGTNEVRGAGSQEVTPALAADQAVSDSAKDGKRKDLNHKNKGGSASASDNQNATQPKQKPPNAQNPPGKGEDRIDRKPGRVGNWKDRCNGPAIEQLQESNLCTHGPDKPPRGFKVDEPVESLSPQVAAESTAGITCEGDGESGYRVQVLYVYGSKNDIGKYRSSIQAWTADMDQIFLNSSNGARRLRFVHDVGCNLVVQDVAVSNASLRDFDMMVKELKNKGFNSETRIYLSFVDTTAAGICGIGSIWNDDRANGDENFNNFGPSYSRLDAGCWNGATAAHELMHNLGGVQLSAPNTSGGYHCIDDYDVMCYSDSPNHPDMRIDCPNNGWDRMQFDCNDDDYYNVAPRAGSYLANYWNPANNRFLVSVGASAVDPGQASVSLVLPNRIKAGKSLTVTATVSDINSVESVAFGVCKGRACTWELSGKLGPADTAAPFSVRWKAPRRGRYTFLAQATDETGNIIPSAPKTVKVTRR
jgi:hypothetical protein